MELAKEYKHVIYVGGLNHDQDLEGQDRADLTLPYGQDRLITELLEVRPDMTIVMLAGSPVSMKPWADRAKAIVWMSYSGMEGGTALAEVLFGAVNPSGKLAETLPEEIPVGTVTLQVADMLEEDPEGVAMSQQEPEEVNTIAKSFVGFI